MQKNGDSQVFSRIFPIFLVSIRIFPENFIEKALSYKAGEFFVESWGGGGWIHPPNNRVPVKTGPLKGAVLTGTLPTYLFSCFPNALERLRNSLEWLWIACQHFRQLLKFEIFLCKIKENRRKSHNWSKFSGGMIVKWPFDAKINPRSIFAYFSWILQAISYPKPLESNPYLFPIELANFL